MLTKKEKKLTIEYLETIDLLTDTLLDYVNYNDNIIHRLDDIKTSIMDIHVLLTDE